MKIVSILALTLLAVVTSSACSSKDTSVGVNCRTSAAGDGCYCDAGIGNVDNSAICEAPAGANSICCASGGWPDNNNCECFEGAVKCAASGSNCECRNARYPTGTAASSATCYANGTTSPPSSGTTTGVCCLGEELCVCYNDRATCPNGTEVPSCSASTLAPKCDRGKTKVSSCRGGSSSTSSSSSTSGSSGQSCDLKKERWYTDCSDGCGDVMACQSFCSGCANKCMVPCETDGDCDAVGAGSCEISAKGSNRCSRAPTKCK